MNITQEQPAEEEEILFITYGTLKKGFGNYRNILENNSEFLGEFVTEPKYTMFDGGFPIVEREGNAPVVGELHRTKDARTIARVFSLEGCTRIQNDPRSWYTYDLIETPHGTAHMFVMDKGNSGRRDVVENGRWGR